MPTEEQIQRARAMLEAKLADGTIDPAREETQSVTIGLILSEVLGDDEDLDIDLNDALAAILWAHYDHLTEQAQ